MDIREAKDNLENALNDFAVASYGPGHWLGDYVFSAHVLDMREGVDTRNNHYLHDGRGVYHSMRGLTEEQADWLIDMKQEEKEDAQNDDDNFH